jgi:hypothetical protein
MQRFRLLLNHTVERSGGDQFSMIDGSPLLTTTPNPALAEGLPDQIPIDG